MVDEDACRFEEDTYAETEEEKEEEDRMPTRKSGPSVRRKTRTDAWTFAFTNPQDCFYYFYDFHQECAFENMEWMRMRKNAVVHNEVTCRELCRSCAVAEANTSVVVVVVVVLVLFVASKSSKWTKRGGGTAQAERAQ